MSLDHGGHLTHGAKVNFSGKLFNAVQYGIRPDNGEIDYDAGASSSRGRAPAEDDRRRLLRLFARASTAQRFARHRRTASAPILFVDMAHVAGLVAAGFYPNPVPHADVVTTTTHKTLRGPRGGLILARANDEITKKLNSLVFPGTQGGPLMHVIAAKAVAFLEALQPEFKDYQQQVLANARAMATRLRERGYKIVSGGTDNHLFLLDLVDKQHHRQGCGRRARPRQHHRQQERRAERPAPADGHQRPAHRHAGLDHARLQGGGDRAGGRLDRRRARCRRRARPRSTRVRGAGARAVPALSGLRPLKARQGRRAAAACTARSAATKRPR